MSAVPVEARSRVVFAPVRHHSPACARMVRDLVLSTRPAVVLIEGPSDFNDCLDQLALPHRLPIAIYSWVEQEDGSRSGAFYPFCVYSPEWQALQAARDVGAQVRFIDLPWSQMVHDEVQPHHRYADGEMRRSPFIDALCERLGVEGFDSLWDTLFEIDRVPGTAVTLEYATRFCEGIREGGAATSEADARRETFMAGQIRRALAETDGAAVVVTGGFHTSALRAALESGTEVAASQPEEEARNAGIALTPYSYARLDSLTGYEAGMPNPGFYHRAWEDREAGAGSTYRRLLAQVAVELRQKKQTVSAADLIAVESMARALADLRGHEEPWRADLIDAITGALVKDELSCGGAHPFLQAVHDVFRGGERGRLAEGTLVPPLVADLRAQLEANDLTPDQKERVVELDLTPEGSMPSSDLARSRALHRLRALDIPGFARAGGSNMSGGGDTVRIWERWHIRWSPEFEAGCIEASAYGATLQDAAAARLHEAAARSERDAESAAAALLDACLMGLDHMAGPLRETLLDLVRRDGDFFSVAAALNRLLYLFRYDDALGSAGRGDVGELLAETFGRAVWLLEGLGQVAGRDADLLLAVSAVVRTFEQCQASAGLDRDELTGVLSRVGADAKQTPLLRGAAAGALWTLGEVEVSSVVSDMGLWSEPALLGDFLTGVFALAREAAQRHPDVVGAVDRLLGAYGDDAFLEALPSLRLAFSFFTPREKHHMARTLVGTWGVDGTGPLQDLAVDAESAAQALRLEAAMLAAARRFGIGRVARLAEGREENAP